MGKTQTASQELSKLMLEKAPASLKGDAETLETRRAEAFKKSTAAFEGASGGEDQAEGEVS